MEKMEVVDLREGSGVMHTGLWYPLLKVAVTLDRVLGGSQVGVEGVSATGGSWVFKFDVLTRTSDLGDSVGILLQFSQLNVEELLEK